MPNKKHASKRTDNSNRDPHIAGLSRLRDGDLSFGLTSQKCWPDLILEQAGKLPEFLWKITQCLYNIRIDRRL